jgi:RNA polymerase sigma factor (sigma-70 family)
MSSPLAAHFFRHEYGRLVAMLSRRVGVHHLEAVEDAVQHALLTALEIWPQAGLPDRPGAWLFRVAHNHVLGELRQGSRRGELARRHVELDRSAGEEGSGVFLAGDVRDDLLRMLFTCCDDGVPLESQLVLALKTLCGFDVREIAQRLFTTEANIYKRLARARDRLRELPAELDDLTSAQLASRLPAVRSVLYLLFTEGYLSAHPDGAIRRELCDEARRLTRLLAEHPVSATPETFALLALMHLHLARLSARLDAAGGLLLLEEQDRSRWDQAEIHAGLAWLARSARGDVFSRFHAEAGIAAEHCLAATFQETRWGRIIECYELLDRLAPSALHTLNRALAVAEHRGPAKGLALLEGLVFPAGLGGSPLLSAVLADLHRRCGNLALARRHGRAAIESAPSDAVRAALRRRLGTAAR